MDSLHAFFEQQSHKFPNKIALICNGIEMTYREIEESANQFAHWLIAKGIKPEDKVGVLMDRSPDLYISMLGILKAGGAYLPIDSEYPAERVKYILEDSNLTLLLTSKIHPAEEFQSDKIIEIQKIKPHLVQQSKDRPQFSGFSPDNVCYVIYTSGTTGFPKGVAITHRAVTNYLQSALKIYGMTDQDRVYQGFTVAFDASMEEIWLALGSGGTLITTASSKVQKGAALVKFLNFHKITLFSTVPTMLAMLEDKIPSLRVLILGGEFCSEELLASWFRPDLRIFNTYGPTEATIIATYQECRPHHPVNIGKPLPNYEVVILDKQLKPVMAGEQGELCIAGIGLAKGYINKPELTAEKFIPYPHDLTKRLYRTGDIASITDSGEIEYVGRIDEQVKIRGFRVELSEIENALKKIPDVRNSVVVESQELHALIGYVVLKNNSTLTSDQMTKFLRKQLPQYMIPLTIIILSEFPKMINGKINKKLLPPPNIKEIEASHQYQAPTTHLEKKIAAIWEKVLNVSSISINADFFADLGGHSLAAATVISEMRMDKEMRTASLINIFENPTIKQLAEQIHDSTQQEETKKVHYYAGPKSIFEKIQYYICAFFQALIALVLVTISPWHFLIITVIVFTFTMNAGFTLEQIILYWLAFLFLLEPGLIVFSIAVKWLILGKIKPGQHKLWSWYYLRWWVVNQLQDLAPIDHLVGSPFIILYCRAMGAKIGKNCYIGTDQFSSFDLFSMGDNSSICADVIASGYKVENGWLKIGAITIGQNCFVGANSVLSINTTLENNSKLGEHSLLSAGQTIPENESYIGSPSRPGFIKLSEDNIQPLPNSYLKNFLLWLCQYSLLMLLEFTYVIAALPGIVMIVYFSYIQKNYFNCIWAIPLAGCLFIILLVLQISLLKKIFGPIKPGSYSIKSFGYLKIWFVERLLGLSLGAMEALYGTIYTAKWFRLMGAKVGKNSEMATVNFSLPDMMEIGKECFIGDSAILSPARIFQGYIHLHPVHIGNHVFIGNGAVIPAGARLSDDCLIASASLSPIDVPENSNWLGTPAVFLPQRDIHSGYSASDTYKPSFKSLIIRGIIEFIKIFLPAACVYLILSLDVMTFVYLKDKYSLLFAILIFPLFSILYVLAEVFLIIFLKWILIGRYQETEAPMWSSFVYRSELVTSLYDNIVVPLFLEAFLGSPYIVYFLRLFGVNIGKYAFINTPYFSEFDLVKIGNSVCLNKDSTIQTHLYEDRIFKMSTITIADGCTVGDRSILLYDTVMQNHSSLGNLSLLMKGEILYPSSDWEGIPSKRVYRSKF